MGERLGDKFQPEFEFISRRVIFIVPRYYVEPNQNSEGGVGIGNCTLETRRPRE